MSTQTARASIHVFCPDEIHTTVRTTDHGVLITSLDFGDGHDAPNLTVSGNADDMRTYVRALFELIDGIETALILEPLTHDEIEVPS